MSSTYDSVIELIDPGIHMNTKDSLKTLSNKAQE